MTGWNEYTALVRHLDHLSADHRRTSTSLAAQRDAMTADLASLDTRLAAQRQRLTQLGAQLRLNQPPPAAPPVFVPDPGQALELARRHADTADQAAAEAEQRAGQAPLLPTWTPLGRNIAIYATCATVTVIVQYLLLVAADRGRIDSVTLLAWMCAGLPAAAWISGYATVSLWGKPRTASTTPVHHLKIGFAICFLALPTVYCAYKLVASTLA